MFNLEIIISPLLEKMVPPRACCGERRKTLRYIKWLIYNSGVTTEHTGPSGSGNVVSEVQRPSEKATAFIPVALREAVFSAVCAADS